MTNIHEARRQIFRTGNPDRASIEPISRNGMTLAFLFFGIDPTRIKGELYSNLHLPSHYPFPPFFFPDPDGPSFSSSTIVNAYRETLPYLRSIQTPLAIFRIENGKESADHALHMNEALRRAHNKNINNTFIYKIIWGEENVLDFPSESEGPYNYKTVIENAAHALGGVFLRFNPDYPTRANERLASFINKVMGGDRTDGIFPNYTEDEIKEIARKI